MSSGLVRGSSMTSRNSRIWSFRPMEGGRERGREGGRVRFALYSRRVDEMREGGRERGRKATSQGSCLTIILSDVILDSHKEGREGGREGRTYHQSARKKDHRRLRGACDKRSGPPPAGAAS